MFSIISRKKKENYHNNTNAETGCEATGNSGYNSYCGPYGSTRPESLMKAPDGYETKYMDVPVFPNINKNDETCDLKESLI